MKILKFLFLSFVLNYSAAQAVVTQIEDLNAENIEKALEQREAKTDTSSMAITAQTNIDAASIESTPAKVDVSDKKSEQDIPVILESKKESRSEVNPWSKMLMALVIVSGLALAAWISVRRYRFSNKAKNPATQMKILAQHHLGPKKSLAIVRVAGESMLVGITDHHISLIKSLALLDEDIPQESPDEFQGLLSEQKDSFALKSKPRQQITLNEKEEDEFSFAGIRDVVTSKLKGMRSIQ